MLSFPTNFYAFSGLTLSFANVGGTVNTMHARSSWAWLAVAAATVSLFTLFEGVPYASIPGVAWSSSRRLTAEQYPHIPLETWDLAKGVELAQSVLSLIRARYELDGSIGRNFWLASNSMKATTWDIMKYKYLVKMLSPNAADRTFTMTFGGSSVTAGHDSYFKQSYSEIVNARMGPVLAALGVELRVHNIAQGANNCSPYQLCYESMGGLDPDWINWEQSYNCGHDQGIFELAARVAGWSKNKAVIYYSASGAWSPGGCEPAEENPPYCSEEFTVAGAGLTEWKPTADDLNKEKGLLDKFASAAQSAQRFYSYHDGSHDYSAVSPHGFNVWESNEHCTGRSKDDTKDITGCNGIDAAQGCKMKFMSHEAGEYGQEGGGGARWHPTRAFHMLRGEAISWLYTMALLDGVLELQARGASDADAAKRSELRTEYDAKLAKLQPPIPASPKYCKDGYHCDVRPVCYTDYLPHYPSDMALKDVIVGKTHWTYEAEEYGEWSLKYGYLDSKPLWIAKGDQGEIHLRVVVGAVVDEVWVCGAVSESLKHTQFFLDQDVPADKMHPYSPNWDNRKEWKRAKYIGNECKAVQGLPQGTHVLSIGTKPAADTEHGSGLSHVIMWP